MNQTRTKTSTSVHKDAKTGRRYSYDATTAQTQWLSNDDGKDGATIEEQDESKQLNRKRPSFRKLVSDKDEVYYQNVETGDVVWAMPKDGELLEL